MKVELLGFTKANPYVGLQTEIARGKSTFVENLIEFAGRVCYRSTDRMGDAPEFIAARLREGHEDIIEHGWVSFEMDYDAVSACRRSGNRYFEITQVDNRFFVSANLRVWLDCLVKEQCYWLVPHLKAIAPNVFALFPAEPIPVTIPQVTLPMVSWLEPMRSGQMSVTLLGANLPSLNPEFWMEHASATFLFEGISRTCTHQLVRHRLASFCISGDTIVPSFRKKSRATGKQWTMKQLWQWSNDPKRKGRIKLIRLRGMNQHGELIPVQIKNVIESGVQSVYRVTTESGRQIKATMNHLFSTPDGWKRLSEISVGDRVWANGVPAYKNEEYLRRRYLSENANRKVLASELGVSDATLGKWIARFQLQKPRKCYPNRRAGHGRKGMFSAKAKQEISARMQGDMNPSWKGDAVGDGGGRARAIKMYEANQCERCMSTYRVQRHHRDKNPTNNKPCNIAILCEPCHKAEHFGQIVMTVFPDKVTSIEFSGNEFTYDLEIDHECHNFVANGFVVHNSQESQRYVDLEKGGWRAIVPPSIASNPQAAKVMTDFWSVAEGKYRELRALGVRKEDARFLLPNAAETRIVTTMNFAAWSHFLWLRAVDKAAQWEIREMGQCVLHTLYGIAPTVFQPQWDVYQEKFNS